MIPLSAGNPVQPRQGGISLMELLVGMLVAGFVVLLAYKGFVFFNSQAVLQKRIAVGQSELISIQAALEKNLRRAGFGIAKTAPQKNLGGGIDTVAALIIAYNGAGPQGLTVRGNFDGALTRTRSPFPRSATALDLAAGTASLFKSGQTIFIGQGDFCEYLSVTAVDAVNSRLTTGARINDYPIGTRIASVAKVEFLPSGTSLSVLANGKSQRLTDQLSELRFYFVGHDNSIDSMPPFDIGNLKYMQYRVKIRVPKPQRLTYVVREASGRILIRNIH